MRNLWNSIVVSLIFGLLPQAGFSQYSSEVLAMPELRQPVTEQIVLTTSYLTDLICEPITKKVESFLAEYRYQAGYLRVSCAGKYQIIVTFNSRSGLSNTTGEELADTLKADYYKMLRSNMPGEDPMVVAEGSVRQSLEDVANAAE